jgi:hypothetical protein
VEPPVPAPEELLAEVWVHAPADAWKHLQHGVSGALALMPSSVAQLVCSLMGLDGELAPLVDVQATSYAVLADAGGGDVAWAFAVPLSGDGRAEEILLGGDVARYTARADGGMRIVTRVGQPLDIAVALSRGWLLLARDDRALARLGPYAYRTMPTRTPPSSSAAIVAVAPQPALAGALGGELSSRWEGARAWLLSRDEEQRAHHGGREPDFADPRGILESLDPAVRRRIAAVAQAQSAQLEIDVSEDDVHAELTLAPSRADGGAGAPLADAMRPGDLEPLAEAPQDAVVALLARDDAAGRAETSRDLASALDRSFGARLHGDDARALHVAIDDWTRGRGDWVSVSLAWGQSRGVWVRTPAASGEVALRSVREIVELARRPVLGEPLQRVLGVGAPRVAAAAVPSFGSMTLATFPRTAKLPAASAPFGVAWGLREADLLVAVGDDAPRLLAAEASSEGNLGGDARVARALAAIGSDAVFALVAQPFRFDPVHARAPSAPAVLAWGRRAGAAWARVEIADTLVREIMRLGAGL